MATIEKTLRSLGEAAKDAKDWFESASRKRTRDEFFARGKVGDDGSGAVYAYFDKGGTALYVGEAGRPIKRRMHDVTSPHAKRDWWTDWTTIRFLQVPDRTDRIVLELLLILAFHPKFNAKPASRELSLMFAVPNFATTCP